eukprot:Em0013g927a
MEPMVVHPVSVVYATLCFLTVLNEASVVAFQSTSSDLEGQDHIYPAPLPGRHPNSAHAGSDAKLFGRLRHQRCHPGNPNSHGHYQRRRYTARVQIAV